LRKPNESGQRTGLITRFAARDSWPKKAGYDLHKNVRDYIFRNGSLQARIGEPKVVGLGSGKRTGFFPATLRSSNRPTDETLKDYVPITEGKISAL